MAFRAKTFRFRSNCSSLRKDTRLLRRRNHGHFWMDLTNRLNCSSRKNGNPKRLQHTKGRALNLLNKQTGKKSKKTTTEATMADKPLDEKSTRQLLQRQHQLLRQAPSFSDIVCENESIISDFTDMEQYMMEGRVVLREISERTDRLLSQERKVHQVVALQSQTGPAPLTNESSCSVSTAMFAGRDTDTEMGFSIQSEGFFADSVTPSDADDASVAGAACPWSYHESGYHRDSPEGAFRDSGSYIVSKAAMGAGHMQDHYCPPVAPPPANTATSMVVERFAL